MLGGKGRESEERVHLMKFVGEKGSREIGLLLDRV